mmetsp:Transcript_44153/g.116701  ORF Transcript_44153/g.116701 Transcript_44153/m.116701 type:complete len:211 (+) Transcript_44153:808-1440(+)
MPVVVSQLELVHGSEEEAAQGHEEEGPSRHGADCHLHHPSRPDVDEGREQTGGGPGHELLRRAVGEERSVGDEHEDRHGNRPLHEAGEVDGAVPAERLRVGVHQTALEHPEVEGGADLAAVLREDHHGVSNAVQGERRSGVSAQELHVGRAGRQEANLHHDRGEDQEEGGPRMAYLIRVRLGPTRRDVAANQRQQNDESGHEGVDQADNP